MSGSAADIHAIELAFDELTKGLDGYPSFGTEGERPTILKIRHISGFGHKLLPVFRERISKLPLRGQVTLTPRSSS